MKELIAEVLEYLKLNVDYAKLTVSDKLSALLASIAMILMLFLLATMALFFLAMAFAEWLSEDLGPGAYVIVFGIYLVLIVLLVTLRVPLVTNPIARYISKLLLKP